jgi:hypothetical protein
LYAFNKIFTPRTLFQTIVSAVPVTEASAMTCGHAALFHTFKKLAHGERVKVSRYGGSWLAGLA